MTDRTTLPAPELLRRPAEESALAQGVTFDV